MKTSKICKIKVLKLNTLILKSKFEMKYLCLTTSKKMKLLQIHSHPLLVLESIFK